MSNNIAKIAKGFKDAIKTPDIKKQSPYDTKATVRRVEGNTAWVHMADGVDETPVQMTIACRPGDIVQVRVGGGKAWLTGNATAPPTDDTTAVKARHEAKTAKESAEEAKIEAVKSAGTATEYLSVQTDGVYVHADDTPSDPTDSDANGVLITDDIDIIRQGINVASFGEDVLIGKAGGRGTSRVKVTSNGLSIPGTSGDVFKIRTVFSGSSGYPVSGEIVFGGSSIGIYNAGSAHTADEYRDDSLNIASSNVCVNNSRFGSDGFYPQYNNVDPMGTIYTSEFGSFSVSNGAWTLIEDSNLEGCFLYLKKGIYIVNAAITFPSNATGRRGIRIATYTARSHGMAGPQSQIEAFTDGSQILGAPSSGAMRVNAFVAGIDLSDETEYGENGAFIAVEAYQNSGSAMTITNSYLRVIRIV